MTGVTAGAGTVRAHPCVLLLVMHAMDPTNFYGDCTLAPAAVSVSSQAQCLDACASVHSLPPSDATGREARCDWPALLAHQLQDAAGAVR